MKKELTVSAPVTAALTTYTGILVSEDSFKQLSNIIDKISNTKEELTDGMRQAATQYTDTWDKLVVERLNKKEEHLNVLCEFFERTRLEYYTISAYCKNCGYLCDINVMEVVINLLRSSDNKEWHKYADKLEDIVERIEEIDNDSNSPDRVDYFDDDERNLGYDDRIIAQKQYELDLAKYQKELFKKQLKVRTAFTKILADITKDPDIKNMVKFMKEQHKKTKAIHSVVHEKSALVKLAINFGGTELLKALQELHEFQREL